MKPKYLCLPMIIFFFLEAGFSDTVKLFSVKPDLLLIGVVIVSIYFSYGPAILFSLLSGILKDTLSVSSFGICTFLFPLFGFLIVKLSRKISLENNFLGCLVVFAFGVLSAISTRLIFLFLGNPIPWYIFLRVTIWGPLYTAVVASLVFRLFRPSIRKI